MPSPVPPPRRHRRLTPARGAALALAAVAALASCSGERPTLADAPTTTAGHRTTTAEAGGPTTGTPLDTSPPSQANVLGFIATPVGAPEVHHEPDDRSPTFDVPATTPLGVPTTFAIVGDPQATGTDWYRVLLPIRPNEATGWVRASTVELTRTDLRLLVDLTDRSIRVEQDGVAVFDADVAIGTEDNPTPTGVSFVTELIENVEPAGAYGPYAFGLSMHSETLTEFQGGDGQVGIHGTDQPTRIGDRVSHGCVRLRNDAIERLVDLQVPLGTPVFIT